VHKVPVCSRGVLTETSSIQRRRRIVYGLEYVKDHAKSFVLNIGGSGGVVCFGDKGRCLLDVLLPIMKNVFLEGPLLFALFHIFISLS
jgi:hypothetical protein